MSSNLKENESVRQRPEEGFRRWFLNSYFDVIFWYEHKGGNLNGFQVCYSKNEFEKVFTWQGKTMSSHYSSDSFMENGISNFATSILSGHAGAIPEEVVERLINERGELETELLELIIAVIKKYNARFLIKS